MINQSKINKYFQNGKKPQNSGRSELLGDNEHRAPRPSGVWGVIMWLSLVTSTSTTRDLGMSWSHSLGCPSRPHPAFKNALLKLFGGSRVWAGISHLFLLSPAVKHLCSQFWCFGLLGLSVSRAQELALSNAARKMHLFLFFKLKFNWFTMSY